jgi:hypothetical protein
VLHLCHDKAWHVTSKDVQAPAVGRDIGTQLAKKTATESTAAAVEDEMPNDFLCGITREVFKDPVVACDGYTYEVLRMQCFGVLFIC